MTHVYVAWHVHVFLEDDESSESDEEAEPSEDSKLLGIFTTRSLAEGCVASLRDRDGFRDQPDGFLIDEHTLNEIYWTEGFKTLTP